MTVTKQLVAALGIAVGLAIFAGTVGFASDVRTIAMKDQCDPETFNKAFGPGTCVKNGGVPLDTFIAQLTHTEKAGAWHFTPDPVRLRDGQAFKARNTGGELHTFTEVDEFGGGLIPELNALSGNPVPANECLDLAPGDFIPAGGETEAETEEPGVHHYMCCIHPWMRTDVIVR
jgi:plastocyanin